MAAQEHRPTSYPEIREPRQGGRSALQRKSLAEGIQRVVFPSITAGRLAQISENRCPVAKARLAMTKLPPHVLKIAGSSEHGTDDYAAQLRQSSSDLSVEWVGEISDMAGFLGELDLFVMVSEPDGCPNASLEAMAAGLPVIATDVGGASEQVIDGQTGKLLARKDTEALAGALVELAWDSASRHRMGLAGLERIRSHFSLERMAESYRRVFFPGHIISNETTENP